MTQASRIAHILGGPAILGREVRSELDMADLVVGGIPARAVVAMVTANVISNDEVPRIAARSTFARRKAQDAKLTPDESDKAQRIARAHTLAVEVLGSEEKARAWLRKSNRALHGRRPFDLLFSDPGMRTVEAILGRIAHGVYS